MAVAQGSSGTAQSAQQASVPKTASAPAAAPVVASSIVSSAPAAKQGTVAIHLANVQSQIDEINRHTGLSLVLASAAYTPVPYPKQLNKGSLSIVVNDAASESAANAQGYS